MLAAMTEDVNDAERIPRSLTVHFCAPAAGEVELTTEVVRVGSRVTHAVARVAARRERTTFGSASFCKDRPLAEHYTHASMPEVPPASGIPELPSGHPGPPRVLRARRCALLRPDEAVLLLSLEGGERDGVGSPSRARARSTRRSPRSSSTRFRRRSPRRSATPRALASVDFTIQFFSRFEEARDEAARGEHHLVAITSRWAGDGYTEELRDLWSPRGVLLAQCRQLIALL